jgi:uncharacterized protein
MIAKTALFAIRLYQWLLSPLLGPVCRYQPSCSHYMAQAIRAHGAPRGVFLGMKRLCRCHPWGGSGYDPVPRQQQNFQTE